MKMELKISLLFGICGILAGIFIVPYQMENMNTYLEIDTQLLLEELPFPSFVLYLISGLQIGIISFVMSFIGLKLAVRTNLHIPILSAWFDTNKKVSISRKWMMYSIFYGVVGGVFLIVLDKHIFQPQIPLLADHIPSTSMIGLIAGILYGGIIEEVLLRLFFMSFLVWIFQKLFLKQRTTIPNYIYWLAIVTAAVFFAIGHFPATIALFGELNSILIIRSFLLNGLLGIVFGYLYWRKGLEYSIVSHMTTHVSMQLIAIPLLY